MENVITLIEQEIKKQEDLKHKAWSCNDYSSYNEICAFISGLTKAKQIIIEHGKTENT